MACNRPLKAFYRIREDGKKDIKFATYEGQTILYDKGVCYSEPIDIPCGQCIACRLEYSRQWAIRCVLESQKYEHNYFITLTYNPESLISNCVRHNYEFNNESGEVINEFDSATLVKDDLRKFMKDLRRYFDYHYGFKGIRFFACGEYGDKLMRPHFHVILFNCPIPDLEFQKTSFNGDVYWTSKILERIWDKGFVCVASCNYSTCSYVSRYMLKKQKGKDSKGYYDKLGLLPPFTLMSRDPGIARTYYDENADKFYNYDSIVIVNNKGIAQKVRPPKYFDRLYDIDSPVKMAEIKEKRVESADNFKRQRLSQTDLSEKEFLAVREDSLSFKVKKLLRPVE